MYHLVCNMQQWIGCSSWPELVRTFILLSEHVHRAYKKPLGTSLQATPQELDSPVKCRTLKRRSFQYRRSETSMHTSPLTLFQPSLRSKLFVMPALQTSRAPLPILTRTHSPYVSCLIQSDKQPCHNYFAQSSFPKTVMSTLLCVPSLCSALTTKRIHLWRWIIWCTLKECGAAHVGSPRRMSRVIVLLG